MQSNKIDKALSTIIICVILIKIAKWLQNEDFNILEDSINITMPL